MALDELFTVALDETLDLKTSVDEFGNKDFVLISGVEYVTQSIQVRLLTIQGEYPFDREFGFPYNQVVGVFNDTFVDGATRRALDPDPDIKEITAIEVEMDEGGQRSITTRIQAVAEDGTELGVEVSI